MTYDILSHQEHISEKLAEGILKLNNLKLLEEKKLIIKKYGAHQGSNYGCNYYHAKNTNPGYSRNYNGNYF